MSKAFNPQSDSDLIRQLQEERDALRNELARSQRALAVFNNCQTVFINSMAEQELLNQLCDVIVNVGGYRMAWVGYARDDDQKTVEPMAWAGNTCEYLENIKISWSEDHAIGWGPGGCAIRDKMPCIIRDITIDENFLPWREAAFRYGFASVMSMPIFLDDDVIGAMSIYAEEKNAFASDEAALLQSLGDCLSHGIQTIRLQEIKGNMDRMLRIYGLIVNSSQDLLALVDKDLVYVAINDQYRHYFNRSSEKIIGRSVKELMQKELYEDVIEPNLKRALAGEIISYESWFDFPHLGRRYINPQYSPCYDENGKVDGVIVAARDITERVQAENARKESEEKFAKAFRSSPDAITISTLEDGTFVDVNDTMLRFCGYSRDEIIGKRTSDLGFWPEWEQREKFADLLKRDRKVRNFETDFQSKNGSIYHCMISAEIFTLDDQDCIITMIRDFTDIKATEQALYESEQRFRNTFEYAPISMALGTIAGTILRVNRAGCELTGFDLDDYVGMNFTDFVHPDDKHKILRSYLTLYKNKTDSYHFESQYRHKSGRFIWMDADVSLIYDDNDQPIYILFQGQDTTERRNVEEQVRLSRERLRNLAGRLQQVREEERTQIAQDIHDVLGQALTGLKMDIAWFADHMTEQDDKVNNRLEAMNTLVDLTLNDMRRMATALRPSVLDDLGLIAAIEWMLQDYSDRTGCKTSLDNRMPDYVSGKERDTVIFRIIQEALTNVARHAEADKVSVLMTQKGNEILIRISDNGVGIDENKLPSTNSLGLIGMRERAGSLGGRVNFLKPPGGGTVLELKIPIKKRRS